MTYFISRQQIDETKSVINFHDILNSPVFLNEIKFSDAERSRGTAKDLLYIIA